MKKNMKTFAAVSATALLASTMATAADGTTVRWRTIVGIIQAGNLVGNIPGGGQPWTTLGGHASVNLSAGMVDFDVRGLVLAGGNAIGEPGAVTQVKGTIVCDAGGANLAIDTPLVALSPLGDASFSGPVGTLPATCTRLNVRFLVRIAAGRWIANGAVASDHE